MMELGSIDPLTLKDFLRSKGWHVVPEGASHRLFIMRNDSFERRELSFPMDTDVADYTDSIQTVVQKFADLTGLRLPEVISAARSVYDDVVQLRIFSSNDRIEIPLSFAADFVKSTEKLLRATACSVVRPRRYHPRLSLAEANQFVDAAKFGQTAEGSFIFKIVCPLNAMDAQTAMYLAEEDAPFVRKVTSNLLGSVQLLTNAIELDNLDHMLDQQKSSDNPILSANLCDALCEMHETGLDNSIDLTINWSPINNALLRSASVGKVRLRKEYFSRIEEIGRELKTSDEAETLTLAATVERLDGIFDEDGKRFGNVLLSAFTIDGQVLKVSTFLSAEQYALADQAHMKKDQFIVLTGSLRPGRQPRQLVDIKSFQLVSDIFS